MKMSIETNEMNKYVADTIRVLAHGARVQIVEILAKRSMCVTEIIKQLKLSSSDTSRHLAIMKRAGIVLSRRDGVHVMYALAMPFTMEFIKGVRRQIRKRFI